MKFLCQLIQKLQPEHTHTHTQTDRHDENITSTAYAGGNKSIIPDFLAERVNFSEWKWQKLRKLNWRKEHGLLTRQLLHLQLPILSISSSFTRFYTTLCFYTYSPNFQVINFSFQSKDIFNLCKKIPKCFST